MRLDVFFHLSSDADAKLDAISAQLAAVLSKEISIMASLDDVAADVSAEPTLIASLSTLMLGFKDQLAAALAGTTLPPAVQAKIDSIFNQAEANKAQIAAAVVAGTPAADVPIDAPPVATA